MKMCLHNESAVIKYVAQHGVFMVVWTAWVCRV